MTYTRKLTRMCSSAVFVALAIVAAPAQATTFTLDFTNDGPSTNLSGSTYSEDGFTLDATNMNSLFNDANFDDLASNLAIVGDFFSITNDGGLSFSLDSFDYQNLITGSPSKRFSVVGYVSGSQVVNYGEFETLSVPSPLTVNTNDATLVDELRFTGLAPTLQSSLFLDGTIWDNIVLTTDMSTPPDDDDPETPAVPLPAGFPLLLAGLGALALAKRRKN